MNVLVLGAGASKSYFESPTHQTMPLARELFSTLRALGIRDNPWVLLHSIAQYLKAKRSTTLDDFIRSNEDIEQFHSEVEEVLIDSIGKQDEFTRYIAGSASVQLRFVFTFILNQIQNGPVSQAHINIARILKPRDRVITFNWDTLIDRALHEETPWRTDWGYFVVPNLIYRDEWGAPARVSEMEGPYLLKLHGSTNWLTSYLAFDGTRMSLTQTSSPDTLYVFEYASKSFPTYAGRYMDGYSPFSYGYYPPNLPDKGIAAKEGHVFVSMRPKYPFMPEGTSKQSGLVAMPLIIPPVKAKDYALFGELFRKVWTCAEDALVRADHILLIGYSFPRTDHQSNELFLNAFSKRNSIPKVTIVNPHPERLEEKFLLEFGIPESHLNIREECFSHESDLTSLLS